MRCPRCAAGSAITGEAHRGSGLPRGLERDDRRRQLVTMTKIVSVGPRTWRNWRRWDAAEPMKTPSSEGTLYSDAHVTNHLIDGCGPYQLLNGLSFSAALGRPSQPLPAIVVRQWWLLDDDDVVPLDQTEYAIYHGGSQLEELAALASCALGIRCRAGGLTRVWWLDNDELGRPVGFDHVTPYLAPPRDHRGSVLPALGGTVDLADLRPSLLAYRDAPAGKATEILRAARMYQQAVWVADDDPNLAWLRLVGAAEIAANHWRGETRTHVEVLRMADPELAALLESKGSEHLSAVAKKLARGLRSQQRFLDWVSRFAPPDPPERPEEWGRVDRNDLEKHLRIIYNYRSEALHAGSPFPAPMCQPPFNPMGGPPLERPIGSASGVGDAAWTAADAPMLLAHFEYIVRGALRGWWLSSDSSNPAR